MHKKMLMAGASVLTMLFAGGALAEQGAIATINEFEEIHSELPLESPTGPAVYDNGYFDFGSRRENEIKDVLPDAGVMHAQQSNGSSNHIAAASAVQANLNGNGGTVTGARVFGASVKNFSMSENSWRTNDILDSFNDFSGVLSVQQNNGDNNVMGAATAVHGNSGGSATMEQFAETIGQSFRNFGEPSEPGQSARRVTDRDSSRFNLIDPAFMGANGVVSAQQNNGNSNAIAIANSVALNTGEGSVSQLARTNGFIAEQLVDDFSLERDNKITDDSFDYSQGIMNVQQNNGDGNVMGVANAVAANEGLHIRTENDVSQRVETKGTVDDTNSSDFNASYPRGRRSNQIEGTFDSASGVMNGQQNNGSNNVMGIANAVQVNSNTSKVSPSGDGQEVVGNQFAVASGDIASPAASEFELLPTPTRSSEAHRNNDISNAFDSMDGIANVQQNNGDNNVMGSANAVVANMYSGDNTDAVLGSTAMTKGSAWGRARDTRTVSNRDNHLTNSFKDADGILNVQQNNGSNNVMAVANAVVANVSTGDRTANGASNAAIGEADVQGSQSYGQYYVDRVNRVDDEAFSDATGIMTIQQNNGDNNILGASTAVVADLGNTGGFGPAASTAELSATVSRNETLVGPTDDMPGVLNSLQAAFSNAKGIAAAQQNNGSSNTIQSAIAVSANLSFD